jgi:hypothetical protein
VPRPGTEGDVLLGLDVDLGKFCDGECENWDAHQSENYEPVLVVFVLERTDPGLQIEQIGPVVFQGFG